MALARGTASIVLIRDSCNSRQLFISPYFTGLAPNPQRVCLSPFNAVSRSRFIPSHLDSYWYSNRSCFHPCSSSHCIWLPPSSPQTHPCLPIQFLMGGAHATAQARAQVPDALAHDAPRLPDPCLQCTRTSAPFLHSQI